MGKARFAGVPTVIPNTGDRVEVLQGEYAGHIFTVLGTEGNVYRSDMRIILEEPDTKSLIWYYAWNLAVLDD